VLEKTKVYVINLDRREDRLTDISVSLGKLGIKFSRIQAVDGARDKASPDTKLLSAGNQACWESHQLVFRTFLKHEASYALVLEDDAEVSGLSNSLLAQMAGFMEETRLDVLQLGFISHLYRLPRVSPLVQALGAFFGRRVFRVKGLGLAVFAEFRAGTHAYMVSKTAAKELIGANLPATLAADNFMAALAFANGKDSEVRMARLWGSRVGQRSRLSKLTQVDSDVA